ncbi:unnamed protein product [Gongylonema pulchrum]|uniref:DHC_N1 domain-containing protein n=1 Tax=Gongylonema pulchrum TaxID=637853 RepID=A0A183DV89_9BILA|nr:unnamed protein product [Gongylonema pulchrum]
MLSLFLLCDLRPILTVNNFEVEEQLFRLYHFSGIVEEIETLRVDELPALGRHYWEGDEMLDFIHAVLMRVKNELQKVPELTEIIVEYCPTTQTITFRKTDVTKDHFFLPDEFIKRFAA